MQKMTRMTRIPPLLCLSFRSHPFLYPLAGKNQSEGSRVLSVPSVPSVLSVIQTTATRSDGDEIKTLEGDELRQVQQAVSERLASNGYSWDRTPIPDFAD